jgi:hypothetical protein
MKNMTPLKRIRLKCLDCSAEQPKEVRLCPVTECALYPLRFGKNPKRKGIGNGSNFGCSSKKNATEPEFL